MAKSTKREKKSRRRLPFTGGAFASAVEIRAGAQEFFLWVVQHHTPEPLKSLRDQVFPKYLAAFEFESGHGRNVDDIKKHACLALVNVMIAEEEESLREVRQFQAELTACRLLYEATDELVLWTKRFNLRGRRVHVDQAQDPNSVKSERNGALWPIVAALETVLDWRFGPGGILRMRRASPLWRAPMAAILKGFPKDPEILPPIKLRGPLCKFPTSAQSDPDGVEQAAWNPGLESEKEFRSRVRFCFELWLDQYIAARKRAAQDAGLFQVPENRELDHFVWTAKFQVSSFPMSKIADSCNRTVEAVKEAIDGVLELINLEKRPGTRGPQRRQNTADGHNRARD